MFYSNAPRLVGGARELVGSLRTCLCNSRQVLLGSSCAYEFIMTVALLGYNTILSGRFWWNLYLAFPGWNRKPSTNWLSLWFSLSDVTDLF
jgi:hypothetical protein